MTVALCLTEGCVSPTPETVLRLPRGPIVASKALSALETLADVAASALETTRKDVASLAQPWPPRARTFPCVLRDMIDESPDDVLRWCDDGCAFVVADTQAFCATVLPKYFRHGRLTSFQRQLSFYQFRRARLAKNGGPIYPSTRNGSPLAYHHPLFARHSNEQQLRAMTRRPRPQRRLEQEEDVARRSRRGSRMRSSSVGLFPQVSD
ncbi:hypothetical protein CTAYLR_004171 [Chrysophaeum taylorii]|uniref:HSF-type DNA-binding domain-containing protein n=1 Tax=Chrysophaeum taylorii TaxID=2483200 RepID=A0AAD7UMP3_9STRA|nr:hypothetical protein CTAYLR_004171 [Chrysophaeum taylorii]